MQLRAHEYLSHKRTQRLLHAYVYVNLHVSRIELFSRFGRATVINLDSMELHCKKCYELHNIQCMKIKNWI